MPSIRLGLLWLLSVVLAVPLCSAPENAVPSIIPRSDLPIKIDGRITEEAWKNALRLTIDYEFQPGNNTPAPVKTECLLLYDNKNIYAAFRAFDPDPAAIRAHLTDRDNAWNDDNIGIWLDTFNDGNRAFFFSVNPFGIQGDEMFSNGGDMEDGTWDAIWSSAGQLTADGYAVELAIPFEALQFHRGAGDLTWGVLLYRNYPRSIRHQIVSVPLDRNQSCFICQSPKITGLAGVKPGRSIELDPTLTVQRSDERPDFPAGPLENAESKADVGISGKWAFTPNLTLSGTLNPDFSQVEADAMQFRINKQFALYYSEKRPFFLEGKDFFATPLEAVYTRTVADPQWGLKLSGKENKQAIALFVARDRLTNLLIPGSQDSASTSLAQPAWAGVLRYRFDVGRSSTVGLLATGRAGDDYFNRLAGVDARLRLFKSGTLVLQYLASSTRYPEATASEFGQDEGAFSGRALQLAYRHSKRTWYAEAGYEDLSPGFRADLGFIPQVDYREWHLEGGLTHWGKGSDFFSQLQTGFELRQSDDYAGSLLQRRLELYASANGPLQSQLFLEGALQRQTFSGATFDMFSSWTSFVIRPSGSLNIFLDLGLGDQIDYENVRLGKRMQLEPKVSLSLGRHLNLVLGHSLNRLQVEGGRLFFAKLSSVQVIYQFNSRAFFRGIAYYMDIKRDPALYLAAVEPREKTLSTQFLFSYKLNPRTVLFLGYTDDASGGATFGLTRSGRTFFAKVGYALVL
jgi:hypothetical protein